MILHQIKIQNSWKIISTKVDDMSHEITYVMILHMPDEITCHMTTYLGHVTLHISHDI